MQTNLHITTPVLENRRLSLALGKNILNKMECYQPTGAFKARGICYLCKHEQAMGKTNLVASSGGNAGLAVAYAARKLQMHATVVVPKTTSATAIERIEQQGAEVLVHGEVWDETDIYARKLAEELSASYIPPFDHPIIWEGHATLSHELKTQIHKPDVIVLSVGGGGLLCGVAQGLHDIGWQDVPIIAAETEGAASFHATLEAGHLVTLPEITSLAITLGARCITEQALKWSRQHEIHSVVVSDQQAVNACLQFADDLRTLVEPACGAALSVAYDNLPILEPYKNILIVICGGVSVSLEQLRLWQAAYPHK